MIQMKLLKQKENKMAEEWVDMEYISLYRYIRNTPSDTEVYAEYQLRVDRSTRPVDKKIYRMRNWTGGGGGGAQEC